MELTVLWSLVMTLLTLAILNLLAAAVILWWYPDRADDDSWK